MDVIIVSYAIDDKFRAMTQQAIDTCGCNVVVIEQNKKVNYNVKTLHYDFRFNYHKCLNLGLKECSGYVALCNNDLRFTEGWDQKLINVLELGFDTVCPFCPASHPRWGFEQGDHYYEGFQVGHEFIGWCIAGKKELFKEVPLNENIEFWYSDNYYAKALQVAKKKHALVANSVVEHLNLGSKTIYAVDKSTMTYLTRGQKAKFNKETRKLYAKGKRI